MPENAPFQKDFCHWRGEHLPYLAPPHYTAELELFKSNDGENKASSRTDDDDHDDDAYNKDNSEDDVNEENVEVDIE